MNDITVKINILYYGNPIRMSIFSKVFNDFFFSHVNPSKIKQIQCHARIVQECKAFIRYIKEIIKLY